MSNRNIPILDVSNFDLSQVSFTKPKKDEYGQRIYINYKNGPFMIKTPVVRFPFGLGKVPEKYNQGPEPKFTMPMTFSEWTDKHEDTAVKQFYNIMMQLEQKVIQFITENSKDLFGKKKSQDVIEEKFNSIFKRGEDKEGNEYPPKMTFKIPYYKGNFGCDVYASKTEHIPLNVDKPEDAIPSGSSGNVVFNMNVYLGANSYSMPINAKFVKVKRRLGATVDFSDVLEDSDEECEQNDSLNREEAEPVASEVQEESEESEEELEEDDSEDEPEPEPQPKKRGRKKLTTPN